MLELRKQSQQEILSISNPNSRSPLPAISWTLHLPPVSSSTCSGQSAFTLSFCEKSPLVPSKCLHSCSLFQCLYLAFPILMPQKHCFFSFPPSKGLREPKLYPAASLPKSLLHLGPLGEGSVASPARGRSGAGRGALASPHSGNSPTLSEGWKGQVSSSPIWRGNECGPFGKQSSNKNLKP